MQHFLNVESQLSSTEEIEKDGLQQAGEWQMSFLLSDSCGNNEARDIN
jgi:hypothetical protein